MRLGMTHCVFQGCQLTIMWKWHYESRWWCVSIHLYIYIYICLDNWISDLCGFGMNWCNFILERPAFLEKETQLVMNHTQLHVFLVHKWIVISCIHIWEQHLSTVCREHAVRLSFKIEWRRKAHVHVFLDPIHCGPICWCNEEKCGLNGSPL